MFRPLKQFFRLISPEKAAFEAMSIERALWRLRQRGMEVATVIDIGASDGTWSAMCGRHFPDAEYLLIEAHPGYKTALDRFCAQRKKASYVLAAAGDKPGEIYFDDHDMTGGQATRTADETHRTVLPQTTVDVEVAARGLLGPYLIKLDTHGYELPILAGAAHTLKTARLVIMEVYNFKISEESLLFHEMIATMRGLGFGVIDMSEPLWRRKDRSLWQFDLAFVPLTRQEFRSNEYR